MAQQRAYVSEALVSKSFGFTEELVDGAHGKIKRITMEGEFQRADEPNKNKRVYSRPLLERETLKLRQFIAERNGLPMGMDHPVPKGNTPEDLAAVQRIDMNNACALCITIEMNGSVVYGKAVALDGDYSTGDKLCSMVRKGFKPGVSSRGLGGEPRFDPRGFTMVPEDYTQVTYDFVTNPSVHNSVLESMVAEEVAMTGAASKGTKPRLWNVMIELRRRYENGR